MANVRRKITRMLPKWFLTFTSGTLAGFAGKCAYDFVTKDSSGEKNPAKCTTSTTDSTLPYGAPQRFPEAAEYEHHVLHYDQGLRIPLWVAEHLTQQHVKGTANRRHSRFKPDPVVPEMFTAQNSDYWKSGWSRGHMAPAGNNKHNQDAMDQSFYLTNVLPQDINNNGDFWNRLEIYCRQLTQHFQHVRVISGPLMVASEDDNGKKHVKYQVIGENDVAVPTHLYKIVLVENEATEPLAAASFVVPNKPIARADQLMDYKVPLEQIERRSGFTFMPSLDRQRLGDLCELHGCELMPSEKFELYMTSRKLASANTVDRLEKVWKELETKNIKPDTFTLELYTTKRAELVDKENASEKL